MEEAKRVEEVFYSDTKEKSQNFMYKEWDERRNRLVRHEDLEIYCEWKRTLLASLKELESKIIRDFLS